MHLPIATSDYNCHDALPPLHIESEWGITDITDYYINKEPERKPSLILEVSDESDIELNINLHHLITCKFLYERFLCNRKKNTLKRAKKALLQELIEINSLHKYSPKIRIGQVNQSKYKKTPNLSERFKCGSILWVNGDTWEIVHSIYTIGLDARGYYEVTLVRILNEDEK